MTTTITDEQIRQMTTSALVKLIASAEVSRQMRELLTSFFGQNVPPPSEPEQALMETATRAEAILNNRVPR